MTTSDTLKQMSKIARRKNLTQQQFLEGLLKFYIAHEVDLKIVDRRFDFNDNVAFIKEV